MARLYWSAASTLARGPERHCAMGRREPRHLHHSGHLPHTIARKRLQTAGMTRIWPESIANGRNRLQMAGVTTPYRKNRCLISRDALSSSAAIGRAWRRAIAETVRRKIMAIMSTREFDFDLLDEVLQA